MRFLIVVSGAVALLGCGERTCTELGCPTPIALTVLESDAWSKDEYEISVTTDAFEERCRLERSSGSVGGGGSTASDGWSCARATKHFEVTFDERGRVVVRLFERAESLDFVIQEEGSEWLSAELSPVYDITTPNGPGCGECARADIEVER